MRLKWCWWWLIGLAAIRLGAQGTGDVVRGRVRDMADRPLAGASVTITGLQTGTTRSARTDSGGRFVAVFLEPEGAYTVLVRQPGFTPALRKVSRSETSGELFAEIALGASPFPMPPLIAYSLRGNWLIHPIWQGWQHFSRV